jgi:Flp pilus assembly protein TadD
MRPLQLLSPLLATALVLSSACATYPSKDDYAPDSFDGAVDRGPSIATLHAMARVMAAQGRDSECEVVLEKLLTEHPDFMPAYNELAELHMRNGSLLSAEATLEAGLQRAPEDPTLLNNMGMALLLEQRYEASLDYFTQAAAADPGDARCRANMATALGMLGRIDEALALYYQVLPPEDAHYNVAVLCRSIGDDERAELEFARAADPRLRRR